MAAQTHNKMQCRNKKNRLNKTDKRGNKKCKNRNPAKDFINECHYYCHTTNDIRFYDKTNNKSYKINKAILHDICEMAEPYTLIGNNNRTEIAVLPSSQRTLTLIDDIDVDKIVLAAENSGGRNNQFSFGCSSSNQSGSGTYVLNPSNTKQYTKNLQNRASVPNLGKRNKAALSKVGASVEEDAKAVETTNDKLEGTKFDKAFETCNKLATATTGTAIKRLSRNSRRISASVGINRNGPFHRDNMNAHEGPIDLHVPLVDDGKRILAVYHIESDGSSVTPHLVPQHKGAQTHTWFGDYNHAGLDAKEWHESVGKHTGYECQNDIDRYMKYYKSCNDNPTNRIWMSLYGRQSMYEVADYFEEQQPKTYTIVRGLGKGQVKSHFGI